MVETVTKDRTSRIALLAFALLTLWWVILNLSGSTGGLPNLIFGAVYGPFMSLFGGILGLRIANQWGGWKSLMGRAINLLSIGLLAQSFGQIVFSVYNIFLHVEIPYPSIADIGFFGTIPFYIYGMYLLSRASGLRVSLRSFASQIQAVVVPLFMIAVAYYLFLRGYEFDWSQPLTIFLDFAYPLGQALFVSLAMLTYSLSRNVLGGVMRSKVLMIVVAFVLQFTADFNFLYQNINGTWFNGGYGDYLYLIAYTLMTLGLIQMGTSTLKVTKK